MELIMLYLLLKKGGVKMEIDYKVIGQRIKEARRGRGWSQEQLSEELDVTTVYISRVERGSTKKISTNWKYIECKYRIFNWRSFTQKS